MTSPQRSVIAVGAGKGGVGKSTVALGLALALRRHGEVGVLDFDFYGPNIAAMVGIQNVRWTDEWTLARRGRPIRFTPVVRDDLHIVSMGFVLGEDQPLGMDPNTAGMVAGQFMHDVDWPTLRFLVIDLPPGTSAVQHTLVRSLKPDGAIVVVTPELLAHVDGRKAVQMFRHLGVRVLGGVENMTTTVCPHCAGQIELYPDAPPERTIWSLGVERLAAIPFSVGGARPFGGDAFLELAEHVSTRMPLG
jgi:ATP-binding protein involved in chromosome partitioning